MKTVLSRWSSNRDNLISLNGPTEIQLIGGTPVVFKIPSLNQLSPCWVQVNYSKNDNELQILGSLTVENPTERLSDFKINYPTKFPIKHPLPIRTFQGQFIYLSFLSASSKEI